MSPNTVQEFQQLRAKHDELDEAILSLKERLWRLIEEGKAVEGLVDVAPAA